MIKHIVMWKLKPEAGGKTALENAEEIKRRLSALPAIIPEIRAFEIGININPSENACDAVLISEFDTLETLKIYREHPEHKKVSQFVKTVRDGRSVVDFEF